MILIGVFIISLVILIGAFYIKFIQVNYMTKYRVIEINSMFQAQFLSSEGEWKDSFPSKDYPRSRFSHKEDAIRYCKIKLEIENPKVVWESGE